MLARATRVTGETVPMPDGFVIMQIGDPDMDAVYATALAPAIEDAGLLPRRIDLDNAGGLLKSEIVDYIESSDVIVADLTNERPNCYLEVGYAMGLGRHRNLILTVRADHLPGEVGHVPGGPKVHFDLAGYDLLLWSADDLAELRAELTKRILRRLAITRDTPLVVAGQPDLAGWTADLAEKGQKQVRDHVGAGYMQVAFGLTPPKIQRTAQDLMEAARGSTIRTFGWPIGIVVEDDESRPRPTGDGIRAEVVGTRWDAEQSYDLWELRTDGDFFLIQSLFEDQRGHSGEIFFNTRIVRVAESILYCARLYERLGVPADAIINMSVAHGGLKDRVLTSATPGRELSMPYRTIVDRVDGQATFALGDVAGQLWELVRSLVAPLFEVFDLFVLSDDVYEQLVDSFVQGKVT